jgi:hypothetical protein
MVEVDLELVELCSEGKEVAMGQPHVGLGKYCQGGDPSGDCIPDSRCWCPSLL